mgnify:CR=1 FL=1
MTKLHLIQGEQDLVSNDFFSKDLGSNMARLNQIDDSSHPDAIRLTQEKVVEHIADTRYLPILNNYTGHGLSDLKGAALMDRVDTKFIIPMERLPLILAELEADNAANYTALEIDGNRLFTYHNTYFDTEDYLFYRLHHQGKLNRFKVRHRYYQDTKTGFIEVKFKNNKGRTIKSRIKSLSPCLESQEVNDFLTSKLVTNSNSFALKEPSAQLQAIQIGSYQRIALADEASSERVTFDLNLNFQSANKYSDEAKSNVHLPQMFIAELKQNKHNINSPFARLMARWEIRSNKFSKYCMGCSLVDPKLKANRFKPVLREMQKVRAIQNLH